jgi:uncharacterized protein (TIGR03437 family)
VVTNEQFPYGTNTHGIGGHSAVMLYASDTQVNIILPYATEPDANFGLTDIALTYGSLTSVWYGPQGPFITPPDGSIPVPTYGTVFVDSAPHIFSSPDGMAEAVNQNGSINSANKPAHRGDIISLYATGEGQTTPAGVDGKIAIAPFPRPKLPVSVTIGGQPVQVIYAGSAPGEVAGLMQVNVQVPPLMSFAGSNPIPGASASGGTVYAVPVVLEVGTGKNGVSPTASIAVQ